MKFALNEIKFYRGPRMEEMKPRIKSMIQNTRKEKAFNQNSRKKKELKKKNEERLRNLWDIFKCTNIRIIGVTEGEEEEQEIKN